MSDFVRRCRREWRRLGVPDALAEEMAADLTADLKEAEDEGVSAEEFLGNSVFDPRAFAASWATERGIIPAPTGQQNARRRPLLLVAFTAVAAVTLLVAGLLLLTGEPTVSLAASTPAGAQAPVPPGASALPPGGPGERVLTNASAPVEWILLFVAIIALGFAAWLWTSWTRSRPPSAAA